MMNKRLIAQAVGDFPFQFYIEKAIPTEENDELYVQGIASTLNVDHDNERMSESALKQMATVINNESVPLRIEHQKGDESVVGKVFKAWIDERNQLWIKALLIKSHPVASLLHKSLKEGVKLGLSVGGRVKRATRELVESVGKQVNTFFDIMIDEVSVTQRPANYDAWLFAKSIAKPGENVQSYYSSTIYNQFLFENPQLNYLQVFEKSVPNSAWMSVEKELNMNNPFKKQEEVKPEEVVKEEEVKPEETIKAEVEVKPEEVAKEDEVKPEEEIKSMKATLKSMAEGISKLTTLVAKALGDASGDVDMPKAGPEGETVKDADEPKAGIEGEMVKEGEEEKLPEEMEKEDMPPVVTGETEKEDENTYGGEYKMPELKSALKAIDSLSARLNKKSEGWKGYAPVRKSVPSIDQFVFAISDALSAIQKNMERDGKRILGLENSIAETVRNDVVLQKSIREMMTEPGVKKSVAMGIPYMISKDGKKFALTANEIGVEKSVKNEGKSFKEVYQTQFSSGVEK